MTNMIISLDGEEKIQTRFWWGNPKQRDQLQNPGTDERILKWIIKKQITWKIHAQMREY